MSLLKNMSCNRERTVALASIVRIIEIHVLLEVGSLCEQLVEIITEREINTFFLAVKTPGVHRRYVLNGRLLLARC